MPAVQRVQALRAQLGEGLRRGAIAVLARLVPAIEEYERYNDEPEHNVDGPLDVPGMANVLQFKHVVSKSLGVVSSSSPLQGGRVLEAELPFSQVLRIMSI
jgi:hypothetical protein